MVLPRDKIHLLNKTSFSSFALLLTWVLSLWLQTISVTRSVPLKNLPAPLNNISAGVMGKCQDSLDRPPLPPALRKRRQRWEGRAAAWSDLMQGEAGLPFGKLWIITPGKCMNRHKCATPVRVFEVNTKQIGQTSPVNILPRLSHANTVLWKAWMSASMMEN